MTDGWTNNEESEMVRTASQTNLQGMGDSARTVL